MTLADVPVQLANKAATVRDGIVTLGIRLRPGEVSNRATQIRVIDGPLEHRAQWEPFHDTRHTDGSFRQIAVHFPARLEGNEDRQVTISEGIAASQPLFTLDPLVSGALGATFALTVEGETRTIALSDVLNQAISTVPFAGGRIGGENTVGHVHRHVHRLRWLDATNTRLRAIWHELVVEFPSRKTRAKVFYSWGYSWCQSGVRLGNPWNDKTMVLTQPVTLRVTGPGVYFVGENKKCNAVSRVGNVTTFTLIDPAQFLPPHTPQFDYRHRNLTQGMSHCLGGELLFGGEPIPATDLDREGVAATAMDWPAKGIPPFGFVPQLPAYIPTRQEAITRLREWENDLYTKGRDADPYFCSGTVGNASTSNTGDAGIYFGTMRLWITLRSGWPGGLGVLLRDIRQEFCRPNNNRYPGYDASLWRYQDFRPTTGLQLYLFNGVPFHLGENNHSPEMLGINGPVGHLGIEFEPDCPQSQINGAWGAWDRQHAMMMVQATVALITADYSVLTLFENYEQVWLGNCDPNSPSDTVTSNEESRAFARGIVRTGMDIWEIRGTQQILDILRVRVRYAISGTPNVGMPDAYHHSPARPGVNFPNTMGSFSDRSPDIQAGSLETVQHGYPWNDSQVAGACDALTSLLTNRYGATDQIVGFARHVSDDMALQVTLYGWVDARGLAPDRYRAVMTNVPSDVMSQAGIRELIAGRTMTGGTTGSTAVVVSFFETDGNAALWVKDASGAFGAEALTFAGSAFTCNADGELGGFLAAKARENTADFHPLTKAELETTATFSLIQPRAPGQQTAILSCTKEPNPVIRLTSPGNPHYLVASSRLVISDDPWPALNGEWAITLVDTETVRLVGCDTSAMPGSYVPSTATQVNRRLWGSRSIKLYKGYGIWQIQAAVLARDAVGRGVYGAVTPGSVAERALLRAQAIIDDFGLTVDTDVPVDKQPRWREIVEHAAVRENPFGSTPTPPTAPINLTARGTSQTTVALSWQNTASNATRIEVQWRLAPAGAWESAPDVAGNATSATVGNLQASTDFEFRVRAVNDVGASGWSNTASARTQGSPPNPPTGFNSPSSTSTSVDLAWTSPAMNNADHLELEFRAVGAGSWTTFPQLAATATTATVGGLAAGTGYEFRIRAVNGFGASAYAGPITVTTPGGAPLPPTSLAAGSATTTSVGLTWVLAGSGAAATSIEIQFRVVGSPAWTSATPAAGNATAATVGGLSASTSYEFQIRATNGSGSSVWVGPVTGITLPTAPTGLVVTPESANSLVAAWANTVANGTSTEVEYRQVGSGTWIPLAPLAGNATTVTVSGLAASTAYEFHVRTVAAGGASTFSGTAQGTTLAGTPSAPTGLAVATVSASQLRPSWTNTANNATSLEVEYRRLGATTWQVIVGLDPATTTITLQGLQAATTYEVRVRARNGTGPSPYAGPVQATTQFGAPAKIAPDAPQDLRVISAFDSIEVFWTIHATNHFGHEVQFREVNTIPWRPAGIVLGNQASLEITAGVLRGKGYEVRVRAFHDEGESGWLGPMAVSVGSTPQNLVTQVQLEIVTAHIAARRANAHVTSQSIAGRFLNYFSIPDLLAMQRDLSSLAAVEMSGPLGTVPVFMRRRQ